MVRRVVAVMLALLSAVLLLTAPGCLLVQREHYVVHDAGTAAQAKIYTYRYYPSSQVYFDQERGWYFYFEADGWKTTYTLPESLKILEAEAVVLVMASERPYSAFETHRQTYPPARV